MHTQPAAHAAATVVAKQRVQHFPGLIQRWQSGEVIRRQHRLIGDVQPAHDDIQPAVEHFSRRFRVDGDVKFRIRRKVAAPGGAAHDHQATDVKAAFGILGQQKRNVG